VSKLASEFPVCFVEIELCAFLDEDLQSHLKSQIVIGMRRRDDDANRTVFEKYKDVFAGSERDCMSCRYKSIRPGIEMLISYCRFLEALHKLGISLDDYNEFQCLFQICSRDQDVGMDLTGFINAVKVGFRHYSILSTKVKNSMVGSVRHSAHNNCFSTQRPTPVEQWAATLLLSNLLACCILSRKQKDRLRGICDLTE
jgi:hypothetical protein